MGSKIMRIAGLRRDNGEDDMTEMMVVGTRRQLSRRIGKLESEVVFRDILLEEVIHRTKNILQLAVSVLGEEADCARDAQSRHIVRNVQKQLVALCQSQSRLFGPNIAGRSLSVRIGEICLSVVGSFSSRVGQIAIAADVAEIPLDRHQEVCISLILQELLTNALKHAFPGGLQGMITVSMRAEASDGHLTVHDNGVGRFEKAAPSTGLTLVNDLAAALGGYFVVTAEHGMIAEVIFPLRECPSRRCASALYPPEVIEQPAGCRDRAS
jgi:two-component sensor histidine kinase